MIKNIFVFCLFAFLYSNTLSKDVFVTMNETLFVKNTVPSRGIVCSNVERVFRLKDHLKDVRHFKTSWGTNVFIGTYKNTPVFIVNAPVGSGSGLVFTELYAAGALYIVRFGSDDVKNPKKEDYYAVKLIDETDNLYGFNEASGVDPSEHGKSVFASPELVKIFKQSALERGLKVELRVCHHLENYHSLRSPEKFSPDRERALRARLKQLKRTDKKESFDMESAVLFRVAKDFDGHAISVLQTVDKESRKGPYTTKRPFEEENKILYYILDSLVSISK